MRKFLLILQISKSTWVQRGRTDAWRRGLDALLPLVSQNSKEKAKHYSRNYWCGVSLLFQLAALATADVSKSYSIVSSFKLKTSHTLKLLLRHWAEMNRAILPVLNGLGFFWSATVYVCLYIITFILTFLPNRASGKRLSISDIQGGKPKAIFVRSWNHFQADYICPQRELTKYRRSVQRCILLKIMLFKSQSRCVQVPIQNITLLLCQKLCICKILLFFRQVLLQTNCSLRCIIDLSFGAVQHF